MANWSNPTLTSAYSDFLAELKARDEDLAKQFDDQTVSNLAVNTIRWNSSVNRWQKWSGTAWGELTTTYALTGLSTTGNASIGGTLTVTGATALGTATATTPATADNDTSVATTAFVKAQGYATLASPALTGTPTAPTAAAGTNTTQLATCAYVNNEIAADALLKTGGTLTGALIGAAGTVSAPGIAVGEAGTGLFRPATDVLAVATTGAEVLRFTAANGIALGSTAANANVGFRHSKSITGGVTAWAQYVDGVIQGDVTTSAIGLGTSLGVAASASIASVTHFQASSATFGAGAAVTTQIGFSASSTLSGATNDYGFYGAIAAASGSWNCYMVGTAANYFAGQVQLGAGTVSAPALSTNGDTDTGVYFPAAGQVAIATNGVQRLLIDASGNVTASGTLTATLATQVPQNAKTAAYTLVADDAGKHISITTGGVTVPASVFSVGDVISVYNNSATAQTITQGASVTLRQAGNTNTGNRTLGAYGVATLLCVAANTFVISGAGLT